MVNFVYPFNFVSPADQLPRPVNNPNQRNRMGGYLPFHKLHRHEGKTGRIEFTLTNLSPLFIPDSEQTTYYRDPDSPNDNPQYHRIMDFFNVGEQKRLAIPSTSLKGMIRGVAEALSNSSFGVFTPPEERFTFRKVTDLGKGVNDLRRRMWGQWTKDGKIQPLKSAKIWRKDFDKAYTLTTHNERSDRYNHLREHNTEVDAKLWQLHTGAEHVREFAGHVVFEDTMTEERDGELHRRKGTEKRGELGSKSEIRVKDEKNPIYGPPIAPILQALGINNGDAGPWHVKFKTVLKVPVVVNKKYATLQERVCWIMRIDSKDKEYTWEVKEHSRKVILWPRKGWKDMTDAQRDLSFYIAALYETGKPLPLKTEDVKQDYKTAYPKSDLPKPGDIVRYYEDRGQIVEFGPVAMFKTPEHATVKEIAGQTPQLLPCKRNDKLCPTSRMFGWTPEEDSQQGEEKLPVAGRVRVSVAWADKTLGDTRLLPLQILGSPKPQYYPFYLRPGNGAPLNQPAYYATPPQAGGWWHNAGLLRGRKFYLHHPDAVFDQQVPIPPQGAPTSPDQACERVKITPEMVKELDDLSSHQNATAAMLPPGAEFKGYVEFDSLSDYELGLLLWAIALADSPRDGCIERAHKLGMGRPIGMGSVRLKIDHIATWDPAGGWRDADDPGEQEITPEEAAQLVKAFKTWMLGEETPDDAQVSIFDNQPFYQDLCNVLSLNLAGNDPVQYYRPGTNAYEGFDYFVKQRQERNQGQEQLLRTPSALRNGDRQT